MVGITSWKMNTKYLLGLNKNIFKVGDHPVVCRFMLQKSLCYDLTFCSLQHTIFFKKAYSFLFMCMCLCEFIWKACVKERAYREQKRVLNSRIQSYRHLWASMWVLETESRSSIRAISTFRDPPSTSYHFSNCIVFYYMKGEFVLCIDPFPTSPLHYAEKKRLEQKTLSIFGVGWLLFYWLSRVSLNSFCGLELTM